MNKQARNDPDLIHCPCCGKTIAKKYKKTEGIIIRCECGADLMVTVTEQGNRIITELPKVPVENRAEGLNLAE